MSEKDLKARVAAARAEGYTDAEIAAYLASEGMANIAEARAEGYDDTEILDFIAGANVTAEAGARAPSPASRAEGIVYGIRSGLKPVAEFARSLNPLEYLADAAENYFAPEMAQRRAQAQARMDAEAERVRAQRPNAFFAGEIAGEIAGTAPLIATGGGVVAAGGRGLARAGGQLAARGVTGGGALQKAGRAIQMGGRAVQTGGVGVRAPTRAAIAGGAPIAATRTGRMGLRVGGGATAGTAAAILTDQELTDAALAGSVVPVLGTIGRRGVGFVYDAVRGRLGEVRAAEVMRNLISSNQSEIANALRDAPADARANTAEFLASQGLLTPELAAATRLATASAEGAPLEQVARARAAGQEEMRAALRGGATGTEAMQNIGAMRQQVGAVTDPMREDALRRADVGRTVMIPQERAAQMEDAIAAEINRSGLVRRMRGLEGRSLEQIGAVFQNPEFFTPGRVVERIGEVAEQAGRRADEGIEAQIALRDSAAARRAAVENLRAQGLQPLDVGMVVGDLRQKAAEAEFVNPPRFRVLTEFANNLERRAASQGDVIDATGLYELRKSMADTVADLLGPMDPGALQRRTAELVGEAKPLIDDAIETAGGSGWRQYLNTFAAGMQNVERQQFARALEKLPEARFERVMAGQDPDFVSKFFGPGRYDINVELFGNQLPTAQRLAGEIRATRAVAATGQEALPPSLRLSHGAGARSRVAEAFQPGMRNVFARMGSRMLGGAPGVYGGGVAADQMAREVSQQISENAMRHLVPGLVSPQGATRLMGAQSSANRVAQFVNRLSPGQRAALGQALTQGAPAAMAPVPATPAAPQGQVLLGFGIGAGGEQYPIYGAAGTQLPDVNLPDIGSPDEPFRGGVTYDPADFDEYGNYIGPR